MGRTASLLKSTAFFGVVLFLFASGFPPFDDATEVDLSTHMLQHITIMFAGILLARPLYNRLKVGTPYGAWGPRFGFVAVSLLVSFWHLPLPWDSAVLDPLIHVLEHASFLVVGILTGSLLRLLSDSGKIAGIMAAFFGHMSYAVVLVSPWNLRVYALYSTANQAILGWVLLLTGPFLLVGVGYIALQNPHWLEGASGSPRPSPRITLSEEQKIALSTLGAVIAAIMVATTAIYFGAVAFAVSSAGTRTGGSVVYIDETPVSWQYTPRAITVVIGVNGTVTWVSHSISYDTVTDSGGAFDSGAIAPGQSFTFTFTTPGTYNYSCIYHPWMTGTVTVVNHS